MADSEEVASRANWTHIVAERHVAEAVDAGVFDNLPGKGKPFVLDDETFSEIRSSKPI